MTQYLLLKHYRGPKDTDQAPADQWSTEDWAAHVRYMDDFADRLRETGEFVSSTVLEPDGLWVRSGEEGQPPETDEPFAETKDLVAGWMIIDVATSERALELAAELSAAPGEGGRPHREWLEVRPVMAEPPTAES